MAKCKYLGISTNNLKNVDVCFNPADIILFEGPSGSGKSSLAVDTIHKISEDELFQLIGLKEDTSSYSIRCYENILPSVCLQQENYNSNPRSTIATYFGLDHAFKQLFAEEHSIPQRVFQYNCPEFSCPACAGLGVSMIPDVLRIVDYSCTIEKVPFRVWRNNDIEYYRQALVVFCRDNDIDVTKQFRQLNVSQQNLLLSGTGLQKHSIRFVSNKRHKTKTSVYKGPVAELSEQITQNKLAHSRKKYLQESICPKCRGKRFSDKVLSYKLHGKSIGDLYQLEASELLFWINEHIRSHKMGRSQARTYEHVQRFLSNILRLSIGYLHLGRSIPSLSGGELQRLRLCKAINTHFRNLIYVLDEPTAGLHPDEWPMIVKIVEDLKARRNTIAIIEHNSAFRGIADSRFILGPEGGCKGGYLVETSAAPMDFQSGIRYFESKKHIEVFSASYMNISNLNVRVPLGTIVGVCGVSGSGKSSFLKGVLPRFLENTIYLNQSPIQGNSYSIVATAINVLTHIQEMYSRKMRVDKSSFVFSSKGKGQCSSCNGTGYLELSSGYGLHHSICPECKGRRFSNIALSYKLNGISIYDLLSMDIDSVLSHIPWEEKATVSALQKMNLIGLGYLSLFRDVSTLSGGEAQRVKLVDAFTKRSTSRTLLLDEPFRGVDDYNAVRILRHLYAMVDDGYSIIMALHDPKILQCCSYIIEFGPRGGNEGGRLLYSGTRLGLKKAQYSRIAHYLT